MTAEANNPYQLSTKATTKKFKTSRDIKEATSSISPGVSYNIRVNRARKSRMSSQRSSDSKEKSYTK